DIVALQRTLYSSRNAARRWLHTSRRDRIWNLIDDPPVQSRRRALEVGRGSGVYLSRLCSAFEQVTAIDVELAHIEAVRTLAASHENLTLVNGDLTDWPWIEPFDLVLCSEVIEHVLEPEQFVAGLR